MTTPDDTNDVFAALIGDAENAMGQHGAISTYATYLHEFYDSLVKSGFSEEQALGMAAQMMTTQQTITMQVVLHQRLNRRDDGE